MATKHFTRKKVRVMSAGDDTGRESAAQRRAIGYGLSLLRIIGEDRLRYLLQTESDMSLDGVEQFLDMLEAGDAH